MRGLTLSNDSANREYIDHDEGHSLINQLHVSWVSSPLDCLSLPFGLRRAWSKIGGVFFLLALLVYYYGTHRGQKIGVSFYGHGAVDHTFKTINETMAHRPLFIFGHSTGHSGTGTFQQSIIQPGCPWSAVVDEFEYLADGEKTWPYDAECSLVQKKLIQHLYSVVANKKTVGLGHGVAYVDLGKKR